MLDADAFVPHADQLALRDAVTSTRLYTLDGVGHAVHWEEPERCAELVAAFVAEIDDADILRHTVFA